MSVYSPFLTDEEILRIVYPLKQPAAIVRWFKGNGFAELKVRPGGMPLITRAYFDQVTTTGVNAATRTGTNDAPAQPNVRAYLDRIARSTKSKNTTKA